MDTAVDEEDPGGEHDPSDEGPFDDKPSESAPSASEHPAAASPTANTQGATYPATSSPAATPSMAEGLGVTGMPYPTYGGDPVATAAPMALAVSEPVASSSTYTGVDEPMPRRYDEASPRPSTCVGPTFIPGCAAPEPGYAMPAPGPTSLSGLRGPESRGGRSRGSGRSYNSFLTRLEIKEDLCGVTGQLVADLTQGIRDKLKRLIPPNGSPMTIGAFPNRVQANELVVVLTQILGGVRSRSTPTPAAIPRSLFVPGTAQPREIHVETPF